MRLFVLWSLLFANAFAGHRDRLFKVTVSPTVAPSTPFNGRLLVYLAKASSGITEPRKRFEDSQDTVQAFGIDLENFNVSSAAIIDSSVFGFPLASLDDLEYGDYFVQAQVLMYDAYQRGDGHNVKLPVSCVNPSGENGAYDSPVGTLYSSTSKITLSPKSSKFAIELIEAVPDRGTPGCAGNGRENSTYIKTHRVKSKLLSQFWGRDIVLEACVLLPFGWESHPETHYPVVISHGHYSAQWAAPVTFEEQPPDPSVVDINSYNFISKTYGNYLFNNWTSEEGAFKGSRMIVLTLNHPVPFFDDSYAVNTANMGPYGDAILHELIADVEREYRGIGKGWARGVFGGSTGGWESLAVQVLYPDEYNGAYVSCPDPISFTSYTSVNIYKDKNAYVYNSDFKKTEKMGTRDFYSGQTIGYGHPYDRLTATVREMNHRELVLGEHSRSCGQWDIWEATFGPVGEDGYPARIWDKMTGEINSTVAEFWRQNFDLKDILERNWHILGPKLQGKLHLYVGAMDSFLLNNAVMDMEDFLRSTNDPISDAEVVIGVHHGRGFEHCFSGYEYDANGNPLPNSITRLTNIQRLLPQFAERFANTAPEGADLSWRDY